MTSDFFRALAARCRTASRQSFDLFAKEEFRQLATEFNAKAEELDCSSKHPGRSLLRRGPKNGLVELNLSSRPRFMRIGREHIGGDIVRRMIAFAISLACLAAGASTMPALASQCASPSEIAASRTRWDGVRKQFVNITDHEMACRIFAASFYESVVTRYATVACARGAERDPDISALDSEINAFNDLLAAKCGS